MGRRPNVLVVMTDQQKATASHLYGSEFGVTPSMERLAKSGTIYDVACIYSNEHICWPPLISFELELFPVLLAAQAVHLSGRYTTSTVRAGTLCILVLSVRAYHWM